MDETSELKEEYPKLIEQNDEEIFDLEAKRRPVILIDTTRDGIMGGVKKRRVLYSALSPCINR